MSIGEAAEREPGFGGTHSGSGAAEGSFRAAQDIGFNPWSGRFDATGRGGSNDAARMSIARVLNSIDMTAGIGLNEAITRDRFPGAAERAIFGGANFMAGQIGLNQRPSLTEEGAGFVTSFDTGKVGAQIGKMAGGPLLGPAIGKIVGAVAPEFERFDTNESLNTMVASRGNPLDAVDDKGRPLSPQQRLQLILSNLRAA